MKTKTYPFKLPDGTGVLLAPFSAEDYDTIDKWIRKKYLENVREACIGLDEQSKLELRIAALSNAAKLTFQTDAGRDIFLSDLQGFARLGYQLIENPPISFESFFKIIYPDGVLSEDSAVTIVSMMNEAYQDDKDFGTAKAAMVKQLRNGTNLETLRDVGTVGSKAKETVEGEKKETVKTDTTT